MSEREVAFVQGSQPTLSGVLVGIMAVGMKDGVPAARLLLRGDCISEVVDLKVGGVISLCNRGSLELLHIVAGHPGEVLFRHSEGAVPSPRP